MVLFEIINGLRKLSTFEEIIPNTRIPMIVIAGAPVMKREINNGAQTIKVPIIGRIPAKIASKDRNNAFGILNIKRPIPRVIP